MIYVIATKLANGNVFNLTCKTEKSAESIKLYVEDILDHASLNYKVSVVPIENSIE